MSNEIHRLLDEAFTGVEMTPEAQDLKEEVRANLVARVAELEAAGRTPSDAARQAAAELGDVREVIRDAARTDDPTPAPARPGPAQLALQNKVRPKPGFVARVVGWSLAVVVAGTLDVLGATDVLSMPPGVLALLLGIVATGAGLIVGDSLAQETTTNHPMPSSRAGGYALATFLAVYGLGFGALIGLDVLGLWALVIAGVAVVGSALLFAFLGATQTNRHKAWTRQAREGYPPNRFEQEPEAAASFGIYTVAIWTVAAAAAIVLGFTVGWWWALLPLVGGFAVMMLVLARMLGGPRHRPS